MPALIRVTVDDLKSGMLLGETIYDDMGNTLLSEGVKLKSKYIIKIKELATEYTHIKICDENYSDIHEVKDSLMIETRHAANGFVKDAFQKLNSSGNLGRDAYDLVNSLIKEILMNDEIVINLNEIRNIDDYTLEHSVNVAVISIVIGISMNLSREELSDLGVGAILHDIGKMLIPNYILNKPSTLSTEEYERVKEHTKYGYELLSKVPGLKEEVLDVARSHHERYDGRGYPLGLKSNGISLYARIVAVSDVYDALTSDRVYKKMIEPYRALEYICSMVNIQFDRDIVRSFLKCIRIYPIGSIVELTTKEVGLVVDIHKNVPHKPIVRVLKDSAGRSVKGYYEIDTSKNVDIDIRNVYLKNQYNLN